jgi:hypothetical protein
LSIDQHQLPAQFIQQRPHQERALGRVGAQVVQQLWGGKPRAAQISDAEDMLELVWLLLAIVNTSCMS